MATKNFTAREFTKHGFVHIAEEDFSDDGTRFQIWEHAETGLRVSYARGNWSGKTEYFIDPREEYYEHGLLYDDVCNEPEYRNAGKFNGCYEVDVEELIDLMKALHGMFLRVKERVEGEEVDTAEVIKRAKHELAEITELLEMARHELRWWTFKEYELRNVARKMQYLEDKTHKLDRIINGECDFREMRRLANNLNKYGYVVDALGNGTTYSDYNAILEYVAA